MIQKWRTGFKNIEKIEDIVVDDVDFSCTAVTLPVFINSNLEDTEYGLINILHIYEKFIEFVDSFDNKSSDLSKLSYCVIMCLNKISKILVNYIKSLDLHSYTLNIDNYFDMDVHSYTPYCQRVYDEVKENIYDIKLELNTVGISKVTVDESSIKEDK